MPFRDREEHDYLNAMTVLIAKARIIIKDANKITNQIQELTEQHIRRSIGSRRKGDSRCSVSQ